LAQRTPFSPDEAHTSVAGFEKPVLKGLNLVVFRMKKSKSLISWAVCSSLVFLAISSFISGQSYQPFNREMERVQQLTRWQIGPFRISPILDFRNIGYDTNIYREREQDDPIADTMATISLDLSTYVIFKDWVILDFVVNPWYAYYSKTKSERAFNFNYSTGAKFNLLHRFVLAGSYSYDRSRRRASSEFDVRADQVRENFIGSFFYETARESSIGITSSIRYISFEDELVPGRELFLSRELDRREWNLSGEFYYSLRQETDFFIQGGYTDYTFDYEESRWRDSYAYEGMAGVRFPILGDIRGMIAVGYKKLNPRAGFKKRFSGPIWNTNVEARLNRFNLRGDFGKDVAFSYWTNNVFFVEYTYGAGLSYYITQFIRLDYDFSYGDNRYPEEILVRLPDESYEMLDRRDKFQTHRIGAVIRIYENTGVGISLNLWRRTSNDPDWGYRKSMFMGGFLTYDF
jgi:opacity protein-like surface antigen